MPRYIDADELKKCSFVIAYKDEQNITQYGEFVEVVRCKDCKHKYYDSDQIICQKLYCCDGDNFVPSEEDFCSHGERSEECQK